MACGAQMSYYAGIYTLEAMTQEATVGKAMMMGSQHRGDDDS